MIIEAKAQARRKFIDKHELATTESCDHAQMAGGNAELIAALKEVGFEHMVPLFIDRLVWNADGAWALYEKPLANERNSVANRAKDDSDADWIASEFAMGSIGMVVAMLFSPQSSEVELHRRRAVLAEELRVNHQLHVERARLEAEQRARNEARFVALQAFNKKDRTERALLKLEAEGVNVPTTAQLREALANEPERSSTLPGEA